MMLATRRPLPRPGLAWGPYPQRRLPAQPGPGVAAMVRAARIGMARAAQTLEPLQQWQLRRFAAQVGQAAKRFEAMDEATLTRWSDAIRTALGQRRVGEAIYVDLFALLAERCRRSLDMRPWPSQIIAARIMLGDRLAEMGTGEGKTLAIALAAAAAALSGVPVHILTANDYLVERDQKSLEPLFASLGLSSGFVLGSSDLPARALAYASHITYVTAREVAFDYLKDRLTTRMADTELDWHVRALATPHSVSEPTLLRGLCMAIVDEADSQLLDDAVTPLILAHRHADERMQARCRDAWAFAGSLWMNRDFAPQAARKRAELTQAGIERAMACRDHGLHRDEWRALVETALSAMHMMHRDVDYVVDEDGVTPVDEPTGRMAHGRQWSRGLHQMIEIKEAIAPSDLQSTAARINFQTLFSRYIRLAGMSGTLRDARSELAAIYRLAVWPVAPRRPSRRLIRAPLLYADGERKWQAALGIAQTAHTLGRPVLLTAESVSHAQALSHQLEANGTAHHLLHASHADDEPAVLRDAGHEGAITIATNIAGRGADIVLDDAARAAGGLLVIACHVNRERRLDRQLFGRCARAGEPGEVIRLAALSDDTLRRHLPRWLLAFSQRLCGTRSRLPCPVAMLLIHLAQTIAQARQRRNRMQLISLSRHNERLLALAGPGE